MSWSLIAIIALSVYSIVVSFFCLRFGIIILRVQDSLQVGLDVIDEKYNSISDILARPLFYDSPEVRQVLQEIAETRDSLHQIAYALTEEVTEEEVPIEDEG